MNEKKQKGIIICLILYIITAVMFGISGILSLVENGISNMMGISNIGLSIVFISLSIIYYKKYKDSKEK